METHWIPIRSIGLFCLLFLFSRKAAMAPRNETFFSFIFAFLREHYFLQK
jgi:hypothetical protein